MPGDRRIDRLRLASAPLMPSEKTLARQGRVAQLLLGKSECRPPVERNTWSTTSSRTTIDGPMKLSLVLGSLALMTLGSSTILGCGDSSVAGGGPGSGGGGDGGSPP